ncbi:hypothetical protein [Ruminococcus sp.]|uniref:hypothetical protein n=1 Tax=Ruminococcus sp. TaxID=41978 RepID=UPI0025F85467|nr:hypothetical protein [Ruminococcus sp.]MBR1433225.1 hypothetical protein [Ruminococcus sp.]
MKTIQDFIKEINGSAELQNAIKAIKDKDALAEFLKKNDVEGTVEDFGKALKVQSEGEMTDNDAEAIAGGRWEWFCDITNYFWGTDL